MTAYKGFSKELKAVLGAGYTFEAGGTYTEEESKTGRNGFHCCENPFECFSYYSPYGSRFWVVEAGGSIDEDKEGRIACTDLTLLKELTLQQMVVCGMEYIIRHPLRERWEISNGDVEVAEDSAEARSKGGIAVARGAYPKVRGPKGAILGLIREPERGNIVNAKIFTVSAAQAGKWYTIGECRSNGTLVEVPGKEGI